MRVGRSYLATPSVWPAPEMQKKYDQIVARAASGQRTEVVLVGDSLMDVAGDPAGLKAVGAGGGIYNASVAGETLPTIAEWTTKVVVPRLHPKVVVVGLSSNELNPSVLTLPSVAAYDASRAVRAAEGTASLADRGDALLRRWSMLYRYRASLRPSFGPPVFDPPLSRDGHDLAFASLKYLQDGGVKRSRLVISSVIAGLKGFAVGPKNVAILQAMLTTLHGQGIRVLLVAMPATADLVSFHPDGAADYRRAMASFAAIARRSGARFEDAGVWPVTEFADPVHLNGVGTVRFSSYLAPLLRQT